MCAPGIRGTVGPARSVRFAASAWARPRPESLEETPTKKYTNHLPITFHSAAENAVCVCRRRATSSCTALGPLSRSAGGCYTLFELLSSNTCWCLGDFLFLTVTFVRVHHLVRLVSIISSGKYFSLKGVSIFIEQLRSEMVWDAENKGKLQECKIIHLWFAIRRKY